MAGDTSRAALTGTFSRSVPAGRSRKPFIASRAVSRVCFEAASWSVPTTGLGAKLKVCFQA